MRLTSDKIYSERPEIRKLVLEKYPLSKDETDGCHTAKAIREHMRFEFAKTIYNQPSKLENDGHVKQFPESQ